MSLLFKAHFKEPIRAGAVTRTYRTWSAARVREGVVYRTTVGALRVDRMRQRPLAEITDSEALLAGFATKAQLEVALGAAAEALVWEVCFTAVEEPPRPDSLPMEALLTRLAKLDAGANGPWTMGALRAIGEHPATVSTALALELGRERFAFKASVRKLKALGLTESLEVGYRLTALGQVVAALPRGSADQV